MIDAGSALSITIFALIHGCFVESMGAVESTDATDHDVGTLIEATSIVKDLSLRAAGAGGVGSHASLTAVGTILTSSVDRVSSYWTALETLEVE